MTTLKKWIPNRNEGYNFSTPITQVGMSICSSLFHFGRIPKDFKPFKDLLLASFRLITRCVYLLSTVENAIYALLDKNQMPQLEMTKHKRNVYDSKYTNYNCSPCSKICFANVLHYLLDPVEPRGSEHGTYAGNTTYHAHMWNVGTLTNFVPWTFKDKSFMLHTRCLRKCIQNIWLFLLKE